MPVKKKKNKAVKRKPSKSIPSREIVSEYQDWKTGDLIWYPQKFGAAPHQGEIKEFHPNDSICPSVSVWDITSGGYRVLPVSHIFEDKKEAKKSRDSYLQLLESLSKKAKI